MISCEVILRLKIYTLAIVVVSLQLSGCGEVKVVDADSSFTKIDPLNEIIAVNSVDEGLSNIECLEIKKIASEVDVVLSDEDRKVFRNALMAHLAPLNYLVRPECSNTIQLKVKEYRVRDLVVASRLIVDVNGSILDADGNQIWSAHYRLTENAGSLPLDPISAGFGIASAMKNSSEDARHNGIYLTIRRLLKALPEHHGLNIPEIVSETPKQVPTAKETKAEQAKTLDDALRLWGKKNYGDALEVMESLYSENTQSDVGYQYGLMLEATGEFDRGARIFSDTAVAQARQSQPEAALRTLRRLQRLNEVNQRRHDSELNRAVQMISDLLQD